MARDVLGTGASAAFLVLGFLSLMDAEGGALARWAALVGRHLALYQPGLAPGTAVLVGLGLLAVGRALMVRRAYARWAGLVYLMALTLAGLRSDASGPFPLGSTALGLALLVAGPHFDVPGAPDVRPALARLLALAVGVDLVLGTLLASLAHVMARPYDHLFSLARLVLGGLSGRRVWLPQGSDAHWLLPLLTAAGALTLLLLLAVLMGAPGAPVDGTRRRSVLVRALADRVDGDSLDPFALRLDKLHFVQTSASQPGGPPDQEGPGLAVVGYRPLFGVGLAGGPPVGPREAAPAALEGFVEHCRRHGWRPAFIGLGEELAPAWRNLGLHGICIGDEAVLDVAAFRLDTPAMRNVRQAVQRTHNFGVTVEILREGDVPRPLAEELEVLSKQALDGVPERGFSMALGDAFSGWHSDCVVVVAYDRDRHPAAFQRYAPCRGGTCLSLDIMRRRPGSPNGLNERMISEVVSWAAGNGVAEVSLNFAAFRTLMDLGERRRRAQRIQYWFVHRLDRWIMVESLYRFNAKFHPRWVPRYVVFDSLGDLPWLLLAALTAEFSLPVQRLSVRSAPDWMPAPEPVTLP